MDYLTNINLNKNELQNAVIQNLSVSPSNPKTGQIYFNTTDNLLYQYDGTSWVPVGADTYITSASFADDSTNSSSSPVKMTLTRNDASSSTVTGNIPKVSSTSAGVAPKGSSVSSQSQSTKFLREDGTWSAPSYTPNNYSDYVKKDGTTAMTGALNMGSHAITSVTDPTNAQDAATKNYVDTQLSGISDAMIFKGTVGKSGGAGTTSTIPTSGVRVGDTYKIIEEDKSISASASTTGSAVTAKIGDTIVATATTPKWTVIPSGDEPSGTVTSVATGSGLTGGPITSSGTISLDTAYGDTVNPYGSKTANYVLASPNGSAGTPSFRALVATDIPDLSTTYKTVQTAKDDPTADGNSTTFIATISQNTNGEITATKKSVNFSGYKTTQTAKTDPTASGTALNFIDSITQDANGEINATKKGITVDAQPTSESSNLITSGAVYAAIQTTVQGTVVVKSVTNPALTASSGMFTWSITADAALKNPNVIVNVYEVSTGTLVIVDIAVNQTTGAISITMNDTANAGSLSADTYKAVLMGVQL